jgi:predicted transcriptional regulator YdeE
LELPELTVITLFRRRMSRWGQLWRFGQSSIPENGLKILDGLSVEVYGPKFDRESANSEFDILVPIRN